MTTAAEAAKRIRQELKARGWSSRQVSVRAANYSMGSSIRVEVRDADISLPTVRAIAKGSEQIRRCEISGDILSGGNRYVNTSYSTGARDELAGRWVENVRSAVESIEPDSNVLERVSDTPFLVGRPDEDRISLWDNDKHIGECFSTGEVAFRIGAALVA